MQEVARNAFCVLARFQCKRDCRFTRVRDIWLRHRNGNGKKYGNNCEAGPETLLDRTSSVGDRAEVYHSHIFDSSLICDDALVVDAYIENSTIRDFTRVIGYPTAWPERLIIRQSLLTGNTRVRDRACLNEVTLHDVIVFGDAHLVGPWELNDYVRIHAGTWRQPPRFHVIEGENINVVLSECTEDRFHIGCWCASYEKWTRKGYRQMLGKHAGWTPAQIETAFEVFTAWRG